MGKLFSPQILSVSARPRCCRASLFALWQALKQPPRDKMIVTMTVTSTAAPSHGFSNPQPLQQAEITTFMSAHWHTTGLPVLHKGGCNECNAQAQA